MEKVAPTEAERPPPTCYDCGEPMELFEDNIKCIDRNRTRDGRIMTVWLCHRHGIVKSYRRPIPPEVELMLAGLDDDLRLRNAEDI